MQNPELLSPPLYNQTEAPQESPHEDIAVSDIVAAYDAAKRNQESYTQLWKDLWNLWRFYKSASSAVKVVDPIGFAMTAGLLSKIFVRPPGFVLSSKTGGWKWLAKILKSYLGRQFDNPDSDTPIDEELNSFVTEMLVLGTAVGKVSWFTKYVTQYEEQQATDEQGNISIQRIPVRKKAYDDPVFSHIPLENFYIQPGARSIAEAKYVIFERDVDRSYLESLLEQIDSTTGEPLYDTAAIEELLAGSGSVDQKSLVEDARRPHGAGNKAEENKNRYHLMEYWEDDAYAVVINKRVLIRGVEDNPNDDGKKPFVAMPYVRVPHEFWGIGALEPVSDLQKVANISLTQRLEYVATLLTQQFSVLTGVEVDEEALIMGYPMVHTGTHDAIKPLDRGSVPQTAFVSAQEITAAIERTMGISGYQVGAPQAAADTTQGTKGGIQSIIQEAQTRFDMTLRRFEKIVIKGIAQRFLELDRQYFGEFEEKLILVNDGQIQTPVPLNRELLRAAEFHVDIIPGSTGIYDRQAKSQQFIAWATFAMGTIPNFNRELAVVEAAEYQDIENPERFILPPQPVATAPVAPANAPA